MSEHIALQIDDDDFDWRNPPCDFAERIRYANFEPVMVDDPTYSLGCALPDLGRVLALALGGVVLVGLLGAWVINRLRGG
jgi:hypothetical protein